MIRIVTESMSDFTQEEAKAADLIVMPLPIRFGMEEYWDDGVSLTQDDFYARLRVAKELPKTSQVPVEHYRKCFNRLLENPEDEVLVIPGSSELSGCCQSACVARAACHGPARVAVLENVMNPTNLGAIFRSAAALGMDAVLLTSAGSDPLYRRAVRVSMGTVFQVPWAYLPEGWTGLLHTLGFRTAAMALRDDSVRLDDPRLAAERKRAVVMGTEGDGLADATIAACDYTVRIPMHHGVDSLNVAAASAVAFYQLGKPAE